MQINKKKIMKIVLDILMALVFVILFNKTALGGMTFHEIAGLAVGAFIIIHMIQNRAWLKGVTKKITNPKLPTRTKVAYIVDALLLIAIAATIVTGIMMSKVVFVGILSVHLNVSSIHKAVSYIALMLMGIHVGLSWNRVVAIIKKLLNIPKKRELRAIATVCAIIVFSLGSFNIVSTGYFDKVVSISSGTAEGGKHFVIEDSEVNSSDRIAPTGGNGIGEMNGEGRHRKTNALMTIYQNLSIVAAFAVFIFYIDKLFRKKPKKTGVDTSNYAASPVE